MHSSLVISHLVLVPFGALDVLICFFGNVLGNGFVTAHTCTTHTHTRTQTHTHMHAHTHTQDVLRARGLSVSGTKPVLVKRLAAAQNEVQETAVEDGKRWSAIQHV